MIDSQKSRRRAEEGLEQTGCATTRYCKITSACGNDKFTDVLNHFENYHPPRVFHANTGSGGFLWVFDDVIDLFRCKFDFHSFVSLLFLGAKIYEKSQQSGLLGKNKH